MIKTETIFVKGGNFTMGSTEGWKDELHIHSVTLSDVYMGKYPVTQKLWMNVMGFNPSRIKGDNLPVTNVSWIDVHEFISKLNEHTGKQYRLPTEAEWEFAAIGGTQSKGYKYSGSNNLDEVAWYYNNSKVGPRPVGQKKPNELGIYDMSGNVFEWCQDWYGEYPSSAQTNPKGPDSGSYRIFRGGSWNVFWQVCRVADRYSYPPNFRLNFLGFRLAHDFETYIE